MQSGSCSAPTTSVPPLGTLALLPTFDVLLPPPPPHAAATRVRARRRTKNGEPCRTCRTLSEPPCPVSEPSAPSSVTPLLCDPDRKDVGREAEDDGRGHRDSVEIALDNGGPCRASAHASAEHVRQSAAPAAVLVTYRRGGVRTERRLDRATDRADDLLVITGRGVASRADRPDRLVGDHHRRHLLAGDTGQPGEDLAVAPVEGASRLPLLERFAHAPDWRHGVGQHRLDLAVYVVLGS